MLVKAAKRRIGDFNAHALANAAWAFATAGFPHAELFVVLAKAAKRRIGNFRTQDVANTAWAFVEVGFTGAEPFAVLVKACWRRIGDYERRREVTPSSTVKIRHRYGLSQHTTANT